MLQIMEEKDLVRRILAGEQSAYHEMIQKYQRLVYHMVARVVSNEQDCEELCQDVFIRIFDRVSAFKFDSKLSTWVATIAYRQALNHVRKTNRRQQEQDLDDVSYQIGTEDRSFEQQDYSAFIQQLIMQMPEQYRIVLTLYHLEGFSYPEIVNITQMPEGTVKNYLFRAKKKLMELSQPYFGIEIELP